jgi:hypothetical protein
MWLVILAGVKFAEWRRVVQDALSSRSGRLSAQACIKDAFLLEQRFTPSWCPSIRSISGARPVMCSLHCGLGWSYA